MLLFFIFYLKTYYNELYTCIIPLQLWCFTLNYFKEVVKKESPAFWGEEQTKKFRSKSSLVAITWSFLHWGAWGREFDWTLLSFIWKMIDNMIYNHNFSFTGWLLLSKHRYFKETSMLEFSWHRANIKTAEHCMPFWSPFSFYNLYKLFWETQVLNFWCTILSSDNF